MGKGKKLLPTTKSDKGKQLPVRHALLHTEPLHSEPSEPLFTSQDDREYGQHVDPDTSDDEMDPPAGQDLLDDDLTQITQESTQETQVSPQDDDDDGEEDRVDDPAPSTSTQPTKKRKEDRAAAVGKRRTYYHIPEDKEALLADWYREQEFLYNKKLRAYRDRERKAKAWEDRATSMGLEGEYQNHVYAPID